MHTWLSFWEIIATKKLKKLEYIFIYHQNLPFLFSVSGRCENIGLDFHIFPNLFFDLQFPKPKHELFGAQSVWKSSTCLRYLP